MSNIYPSCCQRCGGTIAIGRGVSIGNDRFQHSSACSIDLPRDEPDDMNEYVGPGLDKYSLDAPYEYASDFHDSFLD